MFTCHDLPIRCRRIQVGTVLVDAAGAVSVVGVRLGVQVDPLLLG